MLNIELNIEVHVLVKEAGAWAFLYVHYYHIWQYGNLVRCVVQYNLSNERMLARGGICIKLKELYK